MIENPLMIGLGPCHRHLHTDLDVDLTLPHQLSSVVRRSLRIQHGSWEGTQDCGSLPW